jgi:hypothetical protein
MCDRRHRVRPHRARCAAGALGCFALAAAYLAQAWRIIFTLRIGPVIAVVDQAHGHGIHSGDFIGVACFFAGLALLATGAVLLDDAVGTAARLMSIPARMTGPARHRAAHPARPMRPARLTAGRTVSQRRAHRRAWSRPVAA